MKFFLAFLSCASKIDKHSQKYWKSDKFIELNCQFNFRISMGVDRKVPLIGQKLKNCAGNIELGYMTK